MVVKNPPAKKDTCDFQPAGAPFPANPALPTAVMPEATPTPPPAQEMAPVPPNIAEQPVVPAEVAPTPSPMDESSKDVVTAQLLSSHDQPTTAQTAQLIADEESKDVDTAQVISNSESKDVNTAQVITTGAAPSLAPNIAVHCDGCSCSKSPPLPSVPATEPPSCAAASVVTTVAQNTATESPDAPPSSEATPPPPNSRFNWTEFLKVEDLDEDCDDDSTWDESDEEEQSTDSAEYYSDVYWDSEDDNLQSEDRRSIVPSPLNRWAVVHSGDPWPAKKLKVQALNKPLATIPGQNPDQFVALWCNDGEPVMGRIWNDGGKIAGSFGWGGLEYKSQVTFIRVLLYRPDYYRGFDYEWKPFAEAAVLGEKEWHPVHVKHHKRDISPGVLTIDGKQILGEVDVRNERAAVAFDGEEHTFFGPAVHPTMVLCRKAKPGCKLE